MKNHTKIPTINDLISAGFGCDWVISDKNVLVSITREKVYIKKNKFSLLFLVTLSDVTTIKEDVVFESDSYLVSLEWAMSFAVKNSLTFKPFLDEK